MGVALVDGRANVVLMCTTNAELYGRKAKREVHAEVRAISQCARAGIRTAGACIYITMPPCVDCFLAIVAAGISRCVYRGRLRDDNIRLLAERNMIEMCDGADLPNTATWEPEAERVWAKYYARYPDRLPLRLQERRAKAEAAAAEAAVAAATAAISEQNT